jgi:signal transduction histidine kinase
MLTSLQRNVVVANRIARTLGLLSFLLLILLISLFGTNVNSPLIFGLGVLFFTIPMLNKAGYINLGRILLCVVPAFFTLFAAVIAKIREPSFTDMLYYDSRFFLIVFSIVPCLIFDTKEKFLLYGCLIAVFLTLLVFDPVHEFFGVGYFQKNFSGRSYYYINYVAAITFVGITAGAISLKRVVEKAELENEIFKNDLQQVNNKLQQTLNDLEAQNEEISAQSEELYSSQELLLEANNVIEKQKAELQRQVTQVNKELQEANDELVKHNNELQQFSLTISHNLRGPIARLLGLAHLVKLTADFEKNSEPMNIINKIESSAAELDTVIKDLNAVVDIRNSIYKIRELVEFDAEWKYVKSLLNISDEFEEAHFSIDFSAAPSMYSVKPMIQSILLNLVSNAIKYKSPERELEVNIRTQKNNQYTIIEIEDNGLGIDLNLFQNDLFKMYKRFHGHQEGKGLGLYLIKLQVESLNGFVQVESKPNEGSTFKIHLKNQSPPYETEENLKS